MYYTFDMTVRMSGLNLYTHLLCLQKCLTVSHPSGERGASTKITMKVSSDLSSAFNVSDGRNNQLVKSSLCDFSSRGKLSMCDGWMKR